MSDYLMSLLLTVSGSIITITTAFFLLIKTSKFIKTSFIKFIFNEGNKSILDETPFMKDKLLAHNYLINKVNLLSESVAKIKDLNATQDSYLNGITKNIDSLNKISYRLENSAMRSELINQLYYVISKKGKVPTEFWIHLCERYDEYVKRGLNSNVSVLFKEASKFIVKKSDKDD